MDSIDKIPGIGQKRAASLAKHGYDTMEKLRDARFYELTKVPLMGYKSTLNLKAFFGQGIEYCSMKEILEDTMSEPLVVENKPIRPWIEYKKKNQAMQPENFSVERTTVWSFPDRGDWATHTPEYRGNWSPRVVRNILLRYSSEGDLVLDPMVGGGTTLVECALTGRNSIGVDINERSAKITRNRLNFSDGTSSQLRKTNHHVYVGDARNLNILRDEEIDLITLHPPYANIIKYGDRIDGDLSLISDYGLFLDEIGKVAAEVYRVLKPGKYCAVLMGDTHNKGHYVPMAFTTMLKFLKVGFVLKEDVIKHEWNCWSDSKWTKKEYNFLLTMHEHLFIFRKPRINESISDYKNSNYELFRKATLEPVVGDNSLSRTP
jgi:DNA modification methylase